MENFHPGYRDLGASSYEPGQPGWLGFRDLASPLFPSLKFRCVHMRGRAGPVTEISVFATEISVTGMKIFPYEHSSPGSLTVPLSMVQVYK